MASPTPTLPDSDERQGKDSYNPAERLTQEKMGAGYVDAGLDQLESFANDPENASDKIGERERDGTLPPDTNFTSSYGGKKDSGGKVLSGMNVRAILKKRGPLGLIAVIGLGGGIIGTALFSPGIMLVQMKEMLVDRFNYQLAGLETRSDIILNKKIAGNFTSGVCTNPVSIRCKFSTISSKQAERLKAAGIDIENGSQKIGNRIKPGTLVWKGEVIEAKDFSRKFNSDPNFRADMRKAYNPRFAGFADNVWAKVASRIGISKARALPDGDAATKADAIQEDVKNGRKITSIPDDGIDCPSGGGNCTRRSDNSELTPEESSAARATKTAVAEGLEEALDSTVSSADDAIAEVGEAVGAGAGTAVTSVANFLKVTGGADVACQAYTAVRGLGYAAKTVRALQLARYAMVFLNTADQIKEGTAKAEDVAYLGGILTSVAYDVKSGAQRKAAMDSFGMQYASYGTMGGYNNSYVSQFMAGGGLTGDLISVTSWINSSLGGKPREACAFLGNGFVQLGSVAAGVALLLIPGVNVAIGAADIAKAIGSVAVSVGLAVLPGLLKDIVAGTVTEGIVGEDSGNAIASGSSTIMSQLSGARGGAPLTVDQAVAYQGVQNQVLARYAEEDRATLSPLDATSRNTFLGSMVSQLMPYSGSVSSGATALASVPRFLSSAVGSLIPKSSALTAEEATAAFSSCNDPDYVQYLGIAADPFCNPIYGIPTEYLEKDPITIVDELIAANQLSEEGVPQGEYVKFIENCINRERPLGDDGGDPNGNTGEECKVNTAMEANYYLFNLDGTIDEGMDGYASEGGGNESKQALAKKIIAKGNVTYGVFDEFGVEPRLEAIADGSINANDEPCGVNLYILKAIDAITDKYAIRITDINRHCTNSTISNPAGRHYAGNGSAIDIDAFNGQGTTGRDGNAIDVINIIMPILSEAATKAGSYSGLGQAYCGGGVSLGSGVIQFDDTCHHLHFEVPPTADPALKYSPGKAL